MAQHKYRLVIAQGEVYPQSGKIASINIADSGDRIWNIREVDISGAIKYRIDCSINVPHNELHIPFRTALFAEIVSGADGEINILIE